MARVVVLGAGISGHTAALHLRRLLGRRHEVVVVSPNADWNWIPSNIWVGVGDMEPSDVTFPLAPVYAKAGIEFRQAKVVAIRPEGDQERGPCVDIEYTSASRDGESERLTYDYLVNATGPKLNFGATEGLGPDGHSVSVCTAGHAKEAADALAETVAKLRSGQEQTLVVGMGHGTCTCEGAAFEYVTNVEQHLRKAGVRDRARVVFLTNEHELGDFGVDGMLFKDRGMETTSDLWAGSLFRERGIEPILGAHVEKVEDGVVHYELLDGSHHSLEAGFMMLLPPFRGQEITVYGRDGAEITETLFAPNGFTKVDADYTPKPYEEWKASDWPSTYQSQAYDNIWAVGIAFAPPHPISKPRKSPNGTVIAPAPPRTGMPSGVMAKAVAKTIASRIKGDGAEPQRASMAAMGAACVASAGTGLRGGSAAAMTMFPIVPDYDKYPDSGGRDIELTSGEIGLGAHWLKYQLHHLFIYKARRRLGWSKIPE